MAAMPKEKKHNGMSMALRGQIGVPLISVRLPVSASPKTGSQPIQKTCAAKGRARIAEMAINV
jgi:hypothetical protein